jgi:hypothetical protein
MQTTKPQKINLIDNLKQYDAKVISAQNCLKLLLNHKATPKFKDIVWKLIYYFENLEEYEKCKSLKNFLKFNEETFGE